MLLSLFLARGIYLLCVVPPFEGWDEYQHVAYLVHLLENGEPPVLDETPVPESLLQQVVQFPGPDFAVQQIGHVGLLGYGDYWARRTPIRPVRPQSPVLLYEAQHSATVYRILAPIFAVSGGVEDLRRSVGAVRLVNLLAGSLAIWIVLGYLGRLFPDWRQGALVGLLIVLQPLFGINLARVANDAIALLLATIAVVATLEIGSRGLFVRCGLLSVVLYLAIDAKFLNVALVPFVVVCLLWQGRVQGLGTRPTALAVLLVVGGLALLYLAGRGSGLSTAIGARDLLYASRRGVEAGDLVGASLEVDWLNVLRDNWARRSLFSGGWSSVRAPGFLRDAYETLVWAGLAGWLITLARRGRTPLREPASATAWLPCAVLCGSFHTAICLHLLLMQTVWGVPNTNVWYLAPALPWFLVLIHQGSRGWPGRWGALVPWGLVVVFAATNVAGTLFRMLPAYGAAAPGWIALERLAALQPPCFGTLTLIGSLGIWTALLFFAIGLILPAGRSVRRTLTGSRQEAF